MKAGVANTAALGLSPCREHADSGSNGSIGFVHDVWGTHRQYLSAAALERKRWSNPIDTGFPGQFAALENAIAACGVRLTDIRRIIITHQDIDHIGNLPEIVRASGAHVLAHGEEAPYIQGERPLIKADPKRLEQIIQGLPEEQRQRQQAMRLFTNPPAARVDQRLADGEEVPLHGGIRVLHTPGHTPGHVCIYVAPCRLLVAGDELRAENGHMFGPCPANSFGMKDATESLRKLAKMSDLIDLVLCYHGGLYGPGAGRRLQELAAA